jgi:Ca2+-binding EF-hand superfamily protein
MSNSHQWQFARVGGVNRVVLQSGADLQNLQHLDQKLWTALSCPVNGLEIDYKTLAWIDSDHDGKIRVPEVLAAVKWILSLVNTPDDLLQRKTAMPLSAINQDTAEGRSLYASAKQILHYLKKTEQELSVSDTVDTERIFKESEFNGDGIICEKDTKDANLQELIRNIISVAGSQTDRGGQQGISSSEIDAFEAACQSYLAWCDKEKKEAATVLPLGANTAAAHALFLQLRPKIEDYFLRCRLAEFDPETTNTLNTLATRVANINNENLSDRINEISTFPLAKIAANQALSFTAVINPAWSARLNEFKNLLPDVGATLKEAEWQKICQQMDNYAAWQAEKPTLNIESIGVDKIQAFVDKKQGEPLRQLIAQDLELADEANNIVQVDKLVRYYTQIYTLLSNFVSFSDFYDIRKKASFQAGKLYFDQRTLNLCIKVTDIAEHSAMAASSAVCLIYLDCTSKTKGEKMTIVAALTGGDMDNIVVGRNAVFYDNHGLDWDATVVKIVENPISIRQAFWTPYRKIGQLISTQIEKIASAQDAKVSAATTSSIESTSTKVNVAIGDSVKPTVVAPAAVVAAPPVPAPDAAKPVAAPASPAFDIAKFAGIFAAIGLALGAIGGVFTALLNGLLALPAWQIPVVLLAILLVISGPSMLLAWLKLRKRNLAPILDANGWAINAKATINITFGAKLTDLAELPLHAGLNVNDPFKDKSNPWIWVGLVTVVLAITAGMLWYYGYLAQWGLIG